ncbi:MAG: hypothetical protein L0Z51_09940 [Candidatus Latescibacteria bacterium]|nr:hypothetical protein [Candidatus Latescibacterota bacterium]
MMERLRSGLARFRRDLESPLPDHERLTRRQRWRLRTRMLVGKYGWKLVLGVFVYYLIRDLTLYVLLPYLALSFAF